MEEARKQCANISAEYESPDVVSASGTVVDWSLSRSHAWLAVNRLVRAVADV